MAQLRHAQADELSEGPDVVPSDGDERPVEDYMLERAALGRARSENSTLIEST